MGKPVKIRAKLKAGVIQVKALMPHPMESGARRDTESGQLVPAHHINEVKCLHNGQLVMTAHWGTAVSKNPYVSFNVKGGNVGDTIEISWVDNKGDSGTGQATIK